MFAFWFGVLGGTWNRQSMVVYFGSSVNNVVSYRVLNLRFFSGEGWEGMFAVMSIYLNLRSFLFLSVLS